MTLVEQLAEQQRKTAARAIAEMERAHQAEAQTWEQRRESGRAWAYQRAGLPVPPEAPDGVIGRVRVLLAAKDPWDTIPVAKADLAELVEMAQELVVARRNIASEWLYGAWKHRAQVAEAELERLRSAPDQARNL